MPNEKETAAVAQIPLKEKLRRVQEKLDLVLWAAGLAWWDWDVTTGHVDFSPRKVEMLGYTPDEIPPRVEAFIDLIHPDDHDNAMDAMRAHLQGRRPVYEVRYRLRTRDGGWKWLMDRGRVVARNEDGQPLRVTGAVQDIYEIKQAEEERDWLFSLSPDLFTIAGFDGHLKQVNPAWHRRLGWSAPELLQTPWIELVHPDDRKTAESVSAALYDGKPVYDAEIRCRHRDGSWRWLSWNAASRPDREQIFAVAHDVTERKAREQELDRYRQNLEEMVEQRTAELTRANARLEQEVQDRKEAQTQLRRQSEELARSNADLEQFAYIASHDLQEPLRKIRAFGDRLAGKYHDRLDDRGLDYLERMQSAAGRMQAMINELLTLSRVSTQALPFERTDLRELVREATADLEIRLEQTSGTIAIDPLPAADVDPVQIRQVFANLIGNALKFHREGIPPVVKVYTDPETEPSEEICRICISDNGIGFEEKYLDRIFNPFVRLHGRSEFEGSGIGLAICRKIIERHGGGITARSRPGEGTVFLLTLPRSHRKGEQGEHG